MQGNSQDVVLLWGSYRKECVRERERLGEVNRDVAHSIEWLPNALSVLISSRL